MTATDYTPTMIDEPGVVDGMPDDIYHADPVTFGSLSSTGARDILKAPALYRFKREHPVSKPEFDLGHAVHAKVLGVGLPAVAIPAEYLAKNGAVSTTEAKSFVVEARAAGLVPVKADVLAQIDAMAEAVLTHEVAGPLLAHPGKPEQSLFAPDPDTGTWLRARIDYLRDAPVAIDLKTGRSADPALFARSAAEHGYDVQSEFYRHVLRLLRGDRGAFLFVVVESEAPHLVSVIELDAEFAAVGRARMRRAIDLYTECREADEWPGYDAVTHVVGPPRWLAYAEGMVL